MWSGKVRVRVSSVTPVLRTMRKDIEEFLDEIAELNPEALYPTDLADAIVGYVERIGMDPQIVLDKSECLRIFVERDQMSPEEAIEHFEYNVIGSWVGENTPLFITRVQDAV